MFAWKFSHINQSFKYIIELIQEKKPFTCQASKKNALKGDLLPHQATHNDVRSFKCSICPERRYSKQKIS